MQTYLEHIMESLNETKMSPELKDEIENVVTSLKNKTADFKKRYGDKWESVMYALATNVAKRKV